MHSWANGGRLKVKRWDERSGLRLQHELKFRVRKVTLLRWVIRLYE